LIRGSQRFLNISFIADGAETLAGTSHFSDVAPWSKTVRLTVAVNRLSPGAFGKAF
jgi:hypothetical protein